MNTAQQNRIDTVVTIFMGRIDRMAIYRSDEDRKLIMEYTRHALKDLLERERYSEIYTRNRRH